VEDFKDLGTIVSKKSYHHLGLSRHQCGRKNFGPAQTTKPPGHKPLVVNVVVVGSFEEEEEGTGIASELVKVEGEDPATPGYYLRSVDTRKPRDRNDSPTLG